MQDQNNSEPRIVDFMTRKPCTVAADLSLADAQERMFVNNIRHLVVTEGDRVRGVISTRDISVAAALDTVDTSKIRVANAMRKNPYTCTPESTVLEVVKEMEEHRYGCVVVTENSRPVGIFTTTDALRVLRSQITGETATPEVNPTHVVPPPAEREKVEHRVRMGDSVRGPSSNLGRAFDTSS